MINQLLDQLVQDNHDKSTTGPTGAGYCSSTILFSRAPPQQCLSVYTHQRFIPSGKLTVCYGKWPIEIDGFPIKNGDFL